MSRTATIKPMQDWQRILLEDNIALYYKAMRKYGAEKYTDHELGHSVMLRVCSNMSVFDPNKGTIATFIFTLVKYALMHAKRDYAYANAKQKRIFDALQLKLERELGSTNKGHSRSGDLEDALEKLPQRLKDVVGLHYSKQLSLKECGEAIGVSKQRITQLLEIAKNKLAKSMSAGGPL